MFVLNSGDHLKYPTMDEEAMWKNLYETMKEAKNRPPTERESQYVFDREKSIFY